MNLDEALKVCEFIEVMNAYPESNVSKRIAGITFQLEMSEECGDRLHIIDRGCTYDMEATAFEPCIIEGGYLEIEGYHAKWTCKVE